MLQELFWRGRQKSIFEGPRAQGLRTLDVVASGAQNKLRRLQHLRTRAWEAKGPRARDFGGSRHSEEGHQWFEAAGSAKSPPVLGTVDWAIKEKGLKRADIADTDKSTKNNGQGDG